MAILVDQELEGERENFWLQKYCFLFLNYTQGFPLSYSDSNKLMDTLLPFKFTSNLSIQLCIKLTNTES